MLTSKPAAHLLAFLCTLILAFTFISTKMLYNIGMGPMTILMWRSLLAYGVLVLTGPKEIWSGSVASEVRIAFLGIVYVLGYGALQTLAIAAGQTSSVSVASATGPLMTAFLALVMLRNFKVHWLTWLGVTSAAAGVFLLWVDNSIMYDLSLLGIGFALLSAVGWALYSMLLRSLSDMPLRLVARKSLGYGMIALLPFYFLEGSSTEVILLTRWDVIGHLVFLGVVATALVSVMWHRAVKTLGSTSADGWLYLSPVITIIGGIALLDETMSYVGIVGACFILCGIFTAHRGIARISMEVARRG